MSVKFNTNFLLRLMCLQYYLKAQFGYSKDEFANLLLIAGAAGMLSQVRLYFFFSAELLYGRLSSPE
jgi:hypothetical protein